jgi:hypothetical protein
MVQLVDCHIQNTSLFVEIQFEDSIDGCCVFEGLADVRGVADGSPVLFERKLHIQTIDFAHLEEVSRDIVHFCFTLNFKYDLLDLLGRGRSHLPHHHDSDFVHVIDIYNR